MVACQGGNMAGWSLYLDHDGVPAYVYNWFGKDLTVVRGAGGLAAGPHRLVVHYDHDGGFGAGGEVTLTVDGVDVDRARIARTVPIVFSMSGETFDVGRDTGAPVGHYPHDYPCTARIVGVTLERLTEPDAATRRARAEGDRAAGLRAQ